MEFSEVLEAVRKLTQDEKREINFLLSQCLNEELGEVESKKVHLSVFELPDQVEPGTLSTDPQTDFNSLIHQLRQSRIEIEDLKSHIIWMQSSKFWKLRLFFMNYKFINHQRKFAILSEFVLVDLLFRGLFIIRKDGCLAFGNYMLKLIDRVYRKILIKVFSHSLILGVIPRFLLFKLAEPPEYLQWIKDYEPKVMELRRQKKNVPSLGYLPILSVILPVYKVPLSILKETINSVLEQTYPHWELCIVFADVGNTHSRNYLEKLSSQNSRIKLKVLSENLGISGNSNAALELASGGFAVLLDHDDLLPLSAFYEVVVELNRRPDLDFIYSDKDCISASSLVRSRLLLKPQWSPEILYSANYLTHLCIARRDLLVQIGGFRPETDGAQDWDIFLRISEKTSKISRLSSVLYHWRIIQGSTSLGVDSKPYALDAQLRSIQDHLIRVNLPAVASPHPECGFHLHWEIPPARVSIIIDGDVPWETFSVCISAVAEFADPMLHKVKVVLPESLYHTELEKRESLTNTLDITLSWLPFSSQSQKLAVFNEAARGDGSDVILFVSGEIVKFQSGWIQELSNWVLGHPDIGFASGVIVTQENVVVEAGLVVDKYGHGSPLLRGNKLHSWDLFGGALWYRNCTASSARAVAFSCKHYEQIGKLPEDSPSLAHSMIRLCQLSNGFGKRGLSNPHARVYLANMPDNDVPSFDDSLAEDPYFNPAFASVVPLKLRAKNTPRI